MTDITLDLSPVWYPYAIFLSLWEDSLAQSGPSMDAKEGPRRPEAVVPLDAGLNGKRAERLTGIHKSYHMWISKRCANHHFGIEDLRQDKRSHATAHFIHARRRRFHMPRFSVSLLKYGAVGDS